METQKTNDTYINLFKYEVSFLRQFLSKEMLNIELSIARNKFIDTFLTKSLRETDKEIALIREEYALRNPNNEIISDENGQISYGENHELVRRKFESLIAEPVAILIDDQELFSIIRSILKSTKQELNETDTRLFISILDKILA